MSTKRVTVDGHLTTILDVVRAVGPLDRAMRISADCSVLPASGEQAVQRDGNRRVGPGLGISREASDLRRSFALRSSNMKTQLLRMVRRTSNGGRIMIRSLLLLAIGIGLGLGGLVAAPDHKDGEAVRVISSRDIKEKLDGKDAAVKF